MMNIFELIDMLNTNGEYTDMGIKIENNHIVLYKKNTEGSKFILTVDDDGELNINVEGQFIPSDLIAMTDLVTVWKNKGFLTKQEERHTVLENKDEDEEPASNKDVIIEEEVSKEKYKPIYNYKQWTKIEDDFIKTNYDKMSTEEIARRLGRTESSIGNRIHRLKLSGRRHYGRKTWTKEDMEKPTSNKKEKPIHSNKQWTKAEDDFLKTNYDKIPNKEIAQRLGRTEASIKQRSAIFKLSGKIYDKRKPWTKEDINYLKENYDKMTNKEIAKVLKRSENSVSSKAFTLRIENDPSKSGLTWEEEDINYLKNHYDKLSTKEMAENLQRSIRAIDNKARILGLSRNMKETKWTDEEIEFLKENHGEMSNGDLAELLDRTVVAVNNRVSMLGLAKNRRKEEK